MLNEKEITAQEFPPLGRTEKEESDIRFHAAKQVAERHFSDMPFREAYQELKKMEAVLKTMQENGLITIDQVLESISLAGSIGAYICTDGIFERKRGNGLNRADG